MRAQSRLASRTTYFRVPPARDALALREAAVLPSI
jgi:hypothetical protein